MGMYIDPANMSKEDWLAKHGEKTAAPCDISDTHLPVCLVNNGFFTAAAVAYSPSELAVFSDSGDRRRKAWYKVSIADLRAVGAMR